MVVKKRGKQSMAKGCSSGEEVNRLALWLCFLLPFSLLP